MHQFSASIFVTDSLPQDRKTNNRERFSRSSVMQTGAEYNGDFRLHVKLHATHESNDSDRFDGDTEQ